MLAGDGGPRTDRAVFLDRDGVLVENRDTYVRTVSDVAVLPAAVPALRLLNRAGVRVVVVTNQAAVGRGILTQAQVRRVHGSVVARLGAAGGRVDASYVCPHAPEDGCGCRKPAPGMLLRAADDLGLDLSRCALVGDAVTDLEAARAAGVEPHLVLTGRGHAQAGAAGDLDGGHVHRDVRAAAARIVGGS